MWSDKKLLNYYHAVKVKKMFIISFDCTTVVLPKYIDDLFIILSRYNFFFLQRLSLTTVVLRKFIDYLINTILSR